MSIETVCPGCGRKLRVASDDVGKQARCPLCNAIYKVTLGGSTQPGEGHVSVADRQWRMRAPEGQTYGPVARQELDRWVAEGRVTADCQLHCEESGLWQAADTVYEVLKPQPSLVAESQQESSTRTPKYRYTEPHRGTLILVLGILSWVVGCPVFGIVAWTLGSTDLREMRAGRMDPSGMGLTQAGQILGMIHVIILIGVIIVVAFILLAGVAVS